MYLIRLSSPDLVIPMPIGGDLPPNGAVVSSVDLYWRRRETEADVSIVEVVAETVEEAIAEITGRGKGKTAPAAVNPAAEQKG